MSTSRPPILPRTCQPVVGSASLIYEFIGTLSSHSVCFEKRGKDIVTGNQNRKPLAPSNLAQGDACQAGDGVKRVAALSLHAAALHWIVVWNVFRRQLNAK